MHHLRFGAGGREWDDFPEVAEGKEWVVSFLAAEAAGERTLRMRQRDVKQAWRVRVNGTAVGLLAQDENEIVSAWAVPAGVVRAGKNDLRVSCEAGEQTPADDVMVGEAELTDRPLDDALGEATLEVELVDTQTGERMPGRVTVVDERGGLWTVAARPGPCAVRPGVIYVGDGRATVGISAGKHRVYGGRGFEYSVASETVDLRAGETREVRLGIRRVVPTEGYVSCDPHVHTLTYSRHGDATTEERLFTLAGEGVAVGVATEHNLQVDYSAVSQKLGLHRFVTVVRGNEVTTNSLGHFNVFPIAPDAKLINWRPRDWRALRKSIAEVAPGSVVVLNHARDVHGDFAPFSPKRHVSVAGEGLDGNDPPANAMEVINSGATRADPLELFRDYFGMLNRGRRLTPIGASDSHDVARYIVGQGRTYAYVGGAATGATDVGRVVQSVLSGRVSVSYGLLASITVAGRFTPGDLASLPPDNDPLPVTVRVLGPEWTCASRLALYANGVEVARADVDHPPPDRPQPAGVKFERTFTLPRPRHDVNLVALATGPGVTAPYWPCAKPYQPTAPHFEPYVLGATAPVYVDADNNGHFDSAYDYATRVVTDALAASKDAAQVATELATRLADYDEATSAQAASVLRGRKGDDFESVCRRLTDTAPPAVSRGVSTYVDQWKAAGRLEK
jgi:hypothetical protein